jgi:hypothetical protein
MRRKIHQYGSPRRCLGGLMAGCLLALMGSSDAPASEWDAIRESYTNALRTHEKRIEEIEAKERGIPDREQRSAKITRDKAASIRASLKGGGKGKSLAEAADKASGDPRALADLYREQSQHLAVVTSEWGTDGPERKKLREAMAILQKNLDRMESNLARASKAAAATDLKRWEALDKAAQIEATVTEAGDRLRARWQLEQAAREREARQREREAGERARSTRTCC